MAVQSMFAYSREEVQTMMDRLTAIFMSPDRICIDVKRLATTLPLDNHLSIQAAESSARRNDRLQTLPVEVLHSVWQYTDVASLSAVRQTTKLLRNIVSTQKLYTDILKHAPQLLRATLATRAASALTLERAHDLVFADKCCSGRPGCANLGLLVHLPTHERVCYDCLRYEPRFATPRTAPIRKQFLIPFLDIPVLSAIPGFYGTKKTEMKREEGISLFSLNKKRAARGEFVIRSDWIGQYDERSAPAVDIDRMVFAVRVPMIDLSTGEEIRPRVCRGCFKVDPVFKGVQRVTSFSDSGFVEHAMGCVGVSDRIRRTKAGRANDESEIERHFGEEEEGPARI